MDEKEYVIKNIQGHDLIQLLFGVFRIAREVLLLSLLIWGTWAMSVSWGIANPAISTVLSLGLTYTIVDRIVLLILNKNFLWLILRIFVMEKVARKG